ncbi:MAG: carboxypeptidase-like regulatory domain-containing protein, partial [Bryobacteraceae bacterium]
MRSFAILLVASLALESAQTQAGGKKEPAIAEGQVVSAETGEPVVRARVTIRPKVQSTNPEDAPGGFTMQTDDSGTYHFEKLEPGKYEIFVTKAGYLRANYGAKRVNGPGLPIELQSGQTSGKLDVKLYPEATISGVVTDEHGDPVQSSVQLVKRGWKQGKPALLPSNFSNADTQGHFHFSGVGPGKYYVKAQARELSFQHQPQEVDRQGNPVNLHLVSTFYGDTTGLEGAVALQIQPGQEVSDVNIKMRREAVFHIRGRIVSVPPGDSPLNYMPVLMANESWFLWAGGGRRAK